jgi:Flp pilus assembly protein TadG
MLKNKSGIAAIAFALLAIPTILFVGLGIDVGRAYLARQWLQGVVDAAAMAGASAFTDPSREGVARATAQEFLTRGLANPPSGVTVQPGAIQMSAGTGCGPNQASTVKAGASGTVAMSLMRAIRPTMDISVSATGAMPLVELNAKVNNLNFNLGAGDLDTVYWYLVPDGGDPAPSDLIYILSNSLANTNNVPLPYSYSSASSPVPCVFLTQKIGFGFSNQLCERAFQMNGHGYYFVNSYGGACTDPPSVVKYYYSTLFPPTLQAYPTYNCCDFVLQISDVSSWGTDVQGLVTSTYTDSMSTWTVPANWTISYADPNDLSWGLPGPTSIIFPNTTISPAPWAWGGVSVYQGCTGCAWYGSIYQINNPSFGVSPPYPAPGKGYFAANAEPLGTAMNSDGSITCFNLIYGNPVSGSTYKAVHVYWNDGGPSLFYPSQYVWANVFPYNSLPFNKCPWCGQAGQPIGSAFWDPYSYTDADFVFTCAPSASGKVSAYLVR